MPDGSRKVRGVRFAVTTLTVLPVPAPPGSTAPIDRRTAGVAMSIAPAVGVALGLIIGALGIAATTIGATPLLAAALTVGAGIVFTRALHVDGLADTVDALGSYADAETSLAVMRKPDVGPFGVTAIVLVLLAQVAAATAVLGRAWYPALVGVVVATAAGRLGIALACRRGVPAARPDGLGALVAGTVSPLAFVVGAATLTAVAMAAVPGRMWQGPVAVLASLAVVFLLLRHVVRRVGGVTGDVLGAACEAAVTTTYVIVSI